MEVCELWWVWIEVGGHSVILYVCVCAYGDVEWGR